MLHYFQACKSIENYLSEINVQSCLLQPYSVLLRSLRSLFLNYHWLYASGSAYICTVYLHCFASTADKCGISEIIGFCAILSIDFIFKKYYSWLMHVILLMDKPRLNIEHFQNVEIKNNPKPFEFTGDIFRGMSMHKTSFCWFHIEPFYQNLGLSGESNYSFLPITSKKWRYFRMKCACIA